MFELKGKRAIITGASQGFGKEFAARLVDQGCKVCMSDITVEIGEKAKAEIKKKYSLSDDR